MTDAMRAHLHLMETLPRERIHTHEAESRPFWRRAPNHRKPSKQRGVSRKMLAKRYEWLRANAPKMTSEELCRAMKLSPSAVGKRLRKLGIYPRPSLRDQRCDQIRESIRQFAPQHTIAEMEKLLPEVPRSTICYQLNALGIRAKQRRRAAC